VPDSKHALADEEEWKYVSRGKDKAKRQWWRPRFNIRTLTIVVTLACVYFAAWETTKRASVPAVQAQYRRSLLTGSPVAVAPGVVAVPQWSGGVITEDGQILTTPTPTFWDYYICVGKRCWRVSEDRTF
jgi:hypothetical protein